MPSAIITCPSGLTGEIRSAKVRELRTFGEAVKRSFSHAMTDLLQACWTRTDDRGIYPAEPFRWKDVLTGDRLYAWIQMRILGFGADLDFQFQCDDEVCRDIHPEMQGWGSKLDALTVQPLPERSKEQFQAGNRFETTVAGKRVVFQLMTGQLEAEAEARTRGKRSNSSVVVAERLVEVEGVGTKLSALTEWVDDLDAGDLARLGQEMNAADCGVDLSVQVQCDHCRRVVQLEVPFVANFSRLARRATEGAAR